MLMFIGCTLKYGEYHIARTCNKAVNLAVRTMGYSKITKKLSKVNDVINAITNVHFDKVISVDKIPLVMRLPDINFFCRFCQRNT